MPFGRRTPPTVTVNCEGCGKPVATSSKTVAHQVTGWVVPRAGGGANHIRYQTRTGRYAHVACLEEANDPVVANQGSLF